MPKKEKRQKNISINTGEPIEEKDLEINPTTLGDDGEDGEDTLEMDTEELDPFGDKWEQ